jgi:hypothetical protein
MRELWQRIVPRSRVVRYVGAAAVVVLFILTAFAVGRLSLQPTGNSAQETIFAATATATEVAADTPTAEPPVQNTPLQLYASWDVTDHMNQSVVLMAPWSVAWTCNPSQDTNIEIAADGGASGSQSYGNVVACAQSPGSIVYDTDGT